MQISALEVWHVNNEENNSQMCSLESGSADENIETMKVQIIFADKRRTESGD